MNEQELTNTLTSGCANQFAAARITLRLQPTGGTGDKVFPPTYEGSAYAKEERLLEGRRVNSVLLNSVQAEAARIEQALLAGLAEAEISFPTVTLELPERGPLHELEMPHRIFDAYLQEGMVGKQRFWDSPAGKEIHAFLHPNATGLYRHSPVTLLFGGWDTHSQSNSTLASKFRFPRAIVSEIVAHEVTEMGVKPTSKGDPFNLTGPLYEAPDGSWTPRAEEAKKDDKGEPIKFKKTGQPAIVGLGQITPSLKNVDTGNPNPGGFCSNEIRLTAVLSFAALRRLRFPLKPGEAAKNEINTAARAVLAALGIYGLAKAHEAGYWLRSRCDLVADGEAQLEFVKPDGSTEKVALPAASIAAQSFKACVAKAEALKLVWRKEPLALKPSSRLAALIAQQGVL